MEVVESKTVKFTEGLTPTSLNFRETTLNNAKNTILLGDFPTTKNERWKYTRVTKIANKQFKAVENPSLKGTFNQPLEDAYTLLFVNGKLVKNSAQNLPQGVTIESISACTSTLLGQVAKEDWSIFSAINTAYAQDGAYIHIAAKTIVDKPIQIVHVTSGNQLIANTRNLIIADAFSEAEIVHVFLSEDANESFVNNVTEIVVAENAKLTIEKLQNESEENYHVSLEHVKQAKDSNFSINTITLNGGLVRNNLFIDVDGQNVETHLNGAYVLKGNQHVDNQTVVDHLKANCESNELYKGVVDENATAVFNGKVFVRKDAQKINAYQSNGNVLLSDTASVNSKPELEIYADDVKCSHGSTTGQLDEEAIYYFRARGISEKSAKALMVTAFIGDVIDKIENEEVVNYIHKELHNRFGWDF
jgi:Fe-S cluster assembly protein SufD